MTLLSEFRIAQRLALRARYVSISVWLVIGLCVLVSLAAQFSGRQPATVALDVGISVIRLALPLVVVLLLQELLSQEFARRFFLTSMTYPRPRYQFLLGRFLAVLMLGAALLVCLALVLAGLVLVIQKSYQQATPVALDYRYGITVAFMAVDLIVIVAMGALLAIMAVTPSFVLIGTFGFVLVARSFSAVVALLVHDTTLVGDAQAYQSSLNLLGYFLPDLGVLDVRMITLYGHMSFLPSDWPLRVAAAMVYSIGLIAMATWALNRKRFA